MKLNSADGQVILPIKKHNIHARLLEEKKFHDKYIKTWSIFSLQDKSSVISFVMASSPLPRRCSLPVFFLPIKGSLFWLFLRAMTWIVYSVPGSRPDGRTNHYICGLSSSNGSWSLKQASSLQLVASLLIGNGDFALPL